MNYKSAERLNHVGEYYFSSKLKEIAHLRKQGYNIINLGIGNPDLPPHPSVISAMRDSSLFSDVHGYQSYKGLPEFRAAISNWYSRHFGIKPEPEKEILPLAGSKEGIMHIHMAFINSGDEVLVPDPGYPAYAACAKLAGAKVKQFDLKAENNFQPDFAQLNELISPRTKMIWINYPHMPTGTKASRTTFTKLVKVARDNNILICHDNPYSFIQNENKLSIFNIPGAENCAIELNSLSKTYNMAGWRIGFATAGENVITQLLRFKSNMDSGMYLPLQKGAIAALSLPKTWNDELNRVYEKRRVLAEEVLGLLGCNYTRDQAGLFIWARVPDFVNDVEKWIDILIEKYSIFISPGFIFGKNGSDFVRISLCNNEDVFLQVISRLRGKAIRNAV